MGRILTDSTADPMFGPEIDSISPVGKVDETLGDGYGVSFYYGIFCLGTVISCFILLRLNDTEILENIDKNVEK
jgi:hypothetical protein